MQAFIASLNFNAYVSESAADDLQCLLDEFIQSAANVVANDEFDRTQTEIANTVPLMDLVKMSPEEYEAAGLKTIPALDEGSDAPGVIDSDSL